jgi:hypothetical protein
MADPFSPLSQRAMLLQAAGELSLSLQGAAAVIGALVTAMQQEHLEDTGAGGKPEPVGEVDGETVPGSDATGPLNGVQGTQPEPGPRPLVSRDPAPFHLMGGQTVPANP